MSVISSGVGVRYVAAADWLSACSPVRLEGGWSLLLPRPWPSASLAYLSNEGFARTRPNFLDV